MLANPGLSRGEIWLWVKIGKVIFEPDLDFSFYFCVSSVMFHQLEAVLGIFYTHNYP